MLVEGVRPEKAVLQGAAILRDAATRIPIPELRQLIDHSFQCETMIHGQPTRSAAEVWFEEGEARGRLKARIEGSIHGLLRGRTIGQIQLLQQ